VALAKRPDVRLVRRHFPLDPACNPVVKRAIHPGACQLARAAVCADEQGRFGEMDDALFRNQKEKLPVEEVASRAGLDLASFRTCLAAPASAARVAADVAAGIAAGVPATPAYVVGRTVRAGKFPWELLPPPTGGPARP
jgi:protein-disulfide isomerase